MNLLEQANNRVIEINKAMGEIEEFESVVNNAKSSQLSFYQTGGVGTTHITILSKNKLQELKDIVLKAITDAQAEKTAELERLLGISKVAPVTLNTAFENAILDMEEQKTEKTLVVDSGTAKCVVVQKDKPKMTVEDVKRMYHDEAKTMKEIAGYYGVAKSVVNTFIAKHELRRTSYKQGFMDAEVEQRRKKEKQPVKERP